MSIHSGETALQPRQALDLLRAHVSGDFLNIVADLGASSRCELVDQRDGTVYLDMTSYFASAPLGHDHPGLRDPVFEAQLLTAARTKPSNPDVPTVAQARFVEVFRRVLGDEQLPLLFFIEGGAPAVENALKIAFDWKTKRNAQRGVPVRGWRVLHPPVRSFTRCCCRAGNARSGSARRCRSRRMTWTAR